MGKKKSKSAASSSAAAGGAADASSSSDASDDAGPSFRMFQLSRVPNEEELASLQLLRLNDPLQQHGRFILDFLARYQYNQRGTELWAHSSIV